ncbi:hypothetical protein CCHR01_13821 [Colletotrichum chrysophilum]|uniref:Uncharacterized protein n=1 Tax=Colletotrichum chrysophilum TaxID=1836956 RepID=A0AAD9ECU8_9PEZI|nr:hypothetical protein CCHR01_13821 [Colletotrichum chrysophilum]
MGERTGSRVFQWVWSYVLAFIVIQFIFQAGRCVLSLFCADTTQTRE